MARVARVFVPPLHVTSRHAPTRNACWQMACHGVRGAAFHAKRAPARHRRQHGNATSGSAFFERRLITDVLASETGAYLCGLHHASARGPGCILLLSGGHQEQRHYSASGNKSQDSHGCTGFVLVTICTKHQCTEKNIAFACTLLLYE